jgi:hypothetical protein
MQRDKGRQRIKRKGQRQAENKEEKYRGRQRIKSKRTEESRE